MSPRWFISTMVNFTGGLTTCVTLARATFSFVALSIWLDLTLGLEFRSMETTPEAVTVGFDGQILPCLSRNSTVLTGISDIVQGQDVFVKYQYLVVDDRYFMRASLYHRAYGVG